ncbi:hypothetical protein FPV67DRAFT_106913 [Lyophyllum atratum]|nr:hypothetical protein FPV67DRAFT_106913 [Lyophyllum atratum]
MYLLLLVLRSLLLPHPSYSRHGFLLVMYFGFLGSTRCYVHIFSGLPLSLIDAYYDCITSTTHTRLYSFDSQYHSPIPFPAPRSPFPSIPNTLPPARESNNVQEPSISYRKLLICTVYRAVLLILTLFRLYLTSIP